MKTDSKFPDYEIEEFNIQSKQKRWWENYKQRGVYLLYSEWDEVSNNLLKALQEKNVRPGEEKNIYLVSSFEVPDAFMINGEVSIPALLLEDGTVEDYPARIWKALGLR